MLEILNSNTNFNEKPKYHTYGTKNEFSKNITELKTAYTSFQKTDNNKLLPNFEKYKNQQLLNSAQIKSDRCHNCHPHHFHIHHIHIPQERLYEALNLNNLNINTNTSDLMKEVLELKNECRKFREELDKNQNEKNAGDIYIRELENKINRNNKNEDDEKDNSFNRYHEMLDKSFEVLNSVSKKCDDKNAKIKGGIYYYKDKNNDYNQIIEAQKNWINNLPEKNDINNNVQLSNSTLGKTYQINDQINNNQNKYNNLFGNELKNDFNSNNNNRKTSSFNYNPIENNINNEQNNFKHELPNNNNYLSDIQNNDKNKSKLCFDPKRNNNKGYIIKKGEKINNSDNKEKNIIKNNYNTDPNINDEKSKINPINSINLNNNFNYKSFPQNENINDENDNNAENKKNEEENNNINNLNNNDNINQDEEINPLIDRYLIVDKDGNPILINGQKLLAMALIPLIGEDGKETTDENGNIILIGPNGDPKNQHELEPIILDNGNILVNEENKPILGLDGVLLINSEGNLIVGPDELLFNNDQKKMEGTIGIVAKDSKGNPIKINNNNNKINLDENNNKKRRNPYDYNKLRPLLDQEGKPILDSNNNFVILDQNNKPIQNKGIFVLLYQDGKPILNKSGKPILIDKDGNPLNNDFNEINVAPVKIRKNKIKNKRSSKRSINYSQCNPESLKKINFLRPNQNPFYDDMEYKGSCFACDLGCSVSRSGYSCMNYSPYNNRIKRKNVTPIKVINENWQNKKKHFNKKEIKKEKRYYLSNV